MALSKPSKEYLKTQLLDSNYHESLRTTVLEKHVGNIRYFILHSSDPMPEK
jgi:hypothetical protein